jgi:hypothetical protein
MHISFIPCFSPSKVIVDPRRKNVGFAVDEVALARLFCQYFELLLFLPFHQRSILMLSILTKINEKVLQTTQNPVQFQTSDSIKQEVLSRVS